jgi:Domain of unknown function (DUF4365)
MCLRNALAARTVRVGKRGTEAACSRVARECHACRVPLVGVEDRFEQRYTSEFQALLAHHGQFVRYENDRAALDLGLHLYDPAAEPGVLGQVRVWFQLKGIAQSTRSAEDLLASDSVPVAGLKTEHLGYWFAHPEPVYLVVFVEALDRFLAADVRDLVEHRGGVHWLRELREGDQTTATLRVPLTASVEDALSRMPRHRSMRLDGPEFRGRPLGHRFDPLRCELDPLAPADFEALAWRLMAAHDFVPAREINSEVFGDIGTVRAVVGRLYLTYEWTSPLFTEFGFGPDSDFRIESRPFFAHGDVLVVVHSAVSGAPRPTDGLRELVSEVHEAGVEQALVLYNASEGDAALFGSWRMSPKPLVEVPQGLGSMAFSLLTATSVYLEFLDRVSWRLLNYR